MTTDGETSYGLDNAWDKARSRLNCRGGRRIKLRYLGTAKNNTWLKNRTVALNLRNLIGRGLDHRRGAWILA